jgi:hypothetical protein
VTSSTATATAAWDWRCHGLHIRVEGPPHALEGLPERFPGLPPLDGDEGLPRTACRLRVEAAGGGYGAFRITRLDLGAPVELAHGEHREQLPVRLDRALVTTGIECLGSRYLLFHAGVVARGGRGVLLAAPSGSGKTTLVTGLVHAGFSFLSDEIAVVDGAGGTALPFGRAACIKPGAIHLLQSSFPALGTARSYAGYGEAPVTFLAPRPEQWLLAPVPVEAFVFPRYEAGAEPRLEEISRSQALELLVSQCFNLPRHAATGLAQTVALLRGASCHRLVSGDLDAAVALVSRALEARGS